MQPRDRGVLLFLIGVGVAQAENRTTTEELLVEPRTLITLGFEWEIRGDCNRNARDRLPVAIDIYNNDISVMHDNCIESDGAVRGFRNRCVNAVAGRHEPTADLRRAGLLHPHRRLQRVVELVKIHGEPSGIYYLNNTYVGEFKQLTPASNMHLRNNLIMSQATQPKVFALDTFTHYGVVLPNITDGYNGRAPDLGAYEYGAPLPHYGPRNFTHAQGPPSASTTKGTTAQ